MKFTKPGIACCLVLSGYLTCSAVTANPRRPVSAPAAGWHDEMNDLSLWQPLGGINEPDILPVRPGAMTLRLPHVPEGFPYTYQWGGVTRRASVDLGASPVLVAYISRVTDGSYAHLELEERDVAGKHVRTLRTPTLQGRGLSIVDAGQVWGSDTRRLYLRLIVGGSLSGAECEYAWVRFVRREDVPKLQARWGGR